MIEEIKTLLLEFKFQEARNLASDLLKTCNNDSKLKIASIIKTIDACDQTYTLNRLVLDSNLSEIEKHLNSVLITRRIKAIIGTPLEEVK